MCFHLAAGDVRREVDDVRGDGDRVLLGFRLAHPGFAGLPHSGLEDPAHSRIATGAGRSHSHLVEKMFLLMLMLLLLLLLLKLLLCL